MEEKEECMACICPCREHTKHNHPIHEGMEHEAYIRREEHEGVSCRHCGHNHRADRKCDICGCEIK